MCGIAGFVLGEQFRGQVDFNSLAAMTRALIHRGPDDEGYFSAPGIGLGSRRLSIIDLSSAGRMPLFNEARTIAVVQNGEIYNYRSLRRELAAKGHQFRSHSDTEVIVHLYEEAGQDCFRQLEGMYAIAIWDQPRRKLVLARDRFGEKPLYYFNHGGSLAFGSELRSLFRYPYFDSNLDWTSLDEFLTLGYIPAPGSPFQHTRKLQPGSYLVFDQSTGDSKTEKYWIPPATAEPETRKADAEYVDEFNCVFSESVASRLVSDVPVGAFLSGGIDSSLIVAAMAHLNASPVRSFSMGFSHSAQHNENPAAEEVARYLHIEHETLRVELKDLLRVIEHLSHLCDEPLGDPAYVAVYLITQYAKEKGITVMLSGDGGDELFLGYPIYRWVENLDLAYGLDMRLRSVLAGSVNLAARVTRNSRLTKAACALRHETLEGACYYLTGHGAWSIGELRRLKMQPELTVRNENFQASFDGHSVTRSAMDREREALLLTYLPDNNLARMDRASMANSVETRTPFLNPGLMDFAARLPMDMKIRGSVYKYILRQALKGSVPSNILERPKHGFDAFPMGQWMRRELDPLVRYYLDSDRLKKQGIFHAGIVAHTIREHRQGGRFNHWWKLWLLLRLQMWIEDWEENSTHRRMLPSSPAYRAVSSTIS